MTIVSDIEYLIKLFEDTEKYIMGMVTHTILTNPLARSLVFWRRRADLVQVELADLRKQLLKLTPDVVSASLKAGYTAVAPRSWENAGGVNVRAAALLAAGMNIRLDAALATVGRRVNDAFRQAGLRAAAYHAISGTDSVTAAKQMEAALRKQGVIAFVDKANRQWTLKNYTSMVIHTTTREAMCQGSLNGLKETGHELLKVSHHASSCKMCLEFDGKTFSVPGSTNIALLAKYPVISRIPPFHPRCKHSLTTAGDEFDMIEARLLQTYGSTA